MAVRLLSDILQFTLHYTEEGTSPAAVFAATFRLLNRSNGRIINMR